MGLFRDIWYNRKTKYKFSIEIFIVLKKLLISLLLFRITITALLVLLWIILLLNQGDHESQILKKSGFLGPNFSQLLLDSEQNKTEIHLVRAGTRRKEMPKAVCLRVDVKIEFDAYLNGRTTHDFWGTGTLGKEPFIACQMVLWAGKYLVQCWQVEAFYGL